MAASIRARLVRYWQWRLRRHAELCAIDRAVTLGVVYRVRSGSGLAVYIWRARPWLGGRPGSTAAAQVTRHAIWRPASGS